MKSFRHILFPVDFSDRCRSVRPFVQTLAERFQAKLTLLHVVHIPAACYGGFEAGDPVIMGLPTMGQAPQNEMGTVFAGPPMALASWAPLGHPPLRTHPLPHPH